VIDDNPIKAS
jgi:hypothetical protein